MWEALACVSVGLDKGTKRMWPGAGGRLFWQCNKDTILGGVLSILESLWYTDQVTMTVDCTTKISALKLLSSYTRETSTQCVNQFAWYKALNKVMFQLSDIMYGEVYLRLRHSFLCILWSNVVVPKWKSLGPFPPDLLQSKSIRHISTRCILHCRSES